MGEVRSFAGLASYYRNFVPNISTIAAPVFDLTRKGVPFVRDEKCRSAFELFKRKLTAAPVLAAPRDGGNYVVDCGACETGLGAVLQQWQDGQLRVITYASRTLTRKSLLYDEKRAAGNGLWPEAVQTVYSTSQDGCLFRPRRWDVLETSKRAGGAAGPLVRLHRALHAGLRAP